MQQFSAKCTPSTINATRSADHDRKLLAELWAARGPFVLAREGERRQAWRWSAPTLPRALIEGN